MISVVSSGFKIHTSLKFPFLHRALQAWQTGLTSLTFSFSLSFLVFLLSSKQLRSMCSSSAMDLGWFWMCNVLLVFVIFVCEISGGPQEDAWLWAWSHGVTLGYVPVDGYVFGWKLLVGCLVLSKLSDCSSLWFGLVWFSCLWHGSSQGGCSSLCSKHNEVSEGHTPVNSA